MATATLRAFHDRRTGEVDIESAPLGMLLVIAHGDPYDVAVGAGPATAAVGGFAIGPQRCYGSSALDGTAAGVQVDLSWSTAATIFGPELADLADQAVLVSDLTGGAELLDRMIDTTEEERLTLVRGWLDDREHSHHAPSPFALRALRRIETGARSVGHLAAELGCSRGHLHRGVRSATGQSPTTLMRIARLHALTGHRGATSLADLAALGGYVDHAHLCHETRELAGRTPSELFAPAERTGDLTTSPALADRPTVEP